MTFFPDASCEAAIKECELIQAAWTLGKAEKQPTQTRT